MTEHLEIDELLDDYRFDDAERLLADADPGSDGGLREEIARRRGEAETRARELLHRIVELSRENERVELAAIARDPATTQLIRLLPDSSRKQAERHLNEGLRWEERQSEINARRLGEARKALDGLDLELASGLMNKIDGRFLSDELADERDQLLLDIAARRMEVEGLEAAGRRLLADAEPPEEKRDRPWWRRWFG